MNKDSEILIPRLLVVQDGNYARVEADGTPEEIYQLLDAAVRGITQHEAQSNSVSN